MTHKNTILVIDDDSSLRRVIEYVLEQAGYQVLTAEDGAKGLEVYQAERPAMVITDIQMPGLSGYEVLQEIKRRDADCLVVMITAFGTVEQAVTAMKDGAFDYITKPFGNDELLLVVKRALSFRNLQAENQQLRQRLDTQTDFEHLVGISDAMQKVFDMVNRVAPSEATVLIGGESGTGKELIARAIHIRSERADSPFIPVNCAAIPRELLESELFGHLKGSFTGAVKDRKGKFELADGGTLFLDEVGEMPIDLQPKLLRALQEMEIEPVGAGQTRKVDVRVIAASNRNLETAIDNSLFREDLYYRLAVIPLVLPPLRDRKDDIPLLARHFLDRFLPDKRLEFSDQAMKKLQAYGWPGNVRELENAIEQTVILRHGDTIDLNDLPDKVLRQPTDQLCGVVNLPPGGYPLAALEKEAIIQALERSNWNQTKAAELLHTPRHTLIYRMEKYQLKKSE
ncbi:two component, sigma54 specific, transcriptional regulator, Fis family [Malonomonas rubra DSM 5091]|uniref:Two component, sigma54 specific, transcriptional regulator, Fis family n=1 Tax=Malonomonas rubra DSM 5091 TaxID=1122189 RepID=A0A1M6BSR3_MALRU|nr:sigma-54 dependent transcriptional regulator [Malonomonas rubra]SHI51624.1 two component, sigma54 specific, transcriptional regulator, Fis family [Malonomonas rubra DSM 5091]